MLVIRLQYKTAKGWWTGHANLPPTTLLWEAYVAGVNQEGTYHVRVILDDGTIIGDPTCCTECGEPHDGYDSACLI